MRHLQFCRNFTVFFYLRVYWHFYPFLTNAVIFWIRLSFPVTIILNISAQYHTVMCKDTSLKLIIFIDKYRMNLFWVIEQEKFAIHLFKQKLQLWRKSYTHKKTFETPPSTSVNSPRTKYGQYARWHLSPKTTGFSILTGFVWSISGGQGVWAGGPGGGEDPDTTVPRRTTRHTQVSYTWTSGWGVSVPVPCDSNPSFPF